MNGVPVPQSDQLQKEPQPHLLQWQVSWAYPKLIDLRGL